jgi:hypothetical protein
VPAPAHRRRRSAPEVIADIADGLWHADRRYFADGHWRADLATMLRCLE